MSWDYRTGTLQIGALALAYQRGDLKPQQVIDAVYQRIAAAGEDQVWIHLVPRDVALSRARALESQDLDLPLYGIPFAVKDNIDVADLPTTAACPGFAYTARDSATVVERLLQAGGILIGKTNLDQFATGLVGIRSPYGIPRNPFDAQYIPGGSSSGSAVAVSSGLVSFALGTDTAGSGRVPAAFNNIVGLKPTRGFFSTHGVVPACRTLDCVSVFALTCDDAAAVGTVLGEFDSKDPFANRNSSPEHYRTMSTRSFRFGVPAPDSRQFFGDPETPGLFEQACEHLSELGGTPVEIDFEPLRKVANLLYQGPWVAERIVAVKSMLADCPDEMHPVTRAVIENGTRYTAVEVFESLYQLAELRQQIDPMWTGIDILFLPTTGTIYSIEQVLAEPVQRNTDLGYYTNFTNLLDLAAVATPAGFDSRGLPFGVTMLAPAGHDGMLLGLAGRLHRSQDGRLGATDAIVPIRGPEKDQVFLAVAGAHMRGLPLNGQLLEHGAEFVRRCRTAPTYELYEIPNSVPPKPGLVRVLNGGSSIEVEVWRMPFEQFGRFVNLVPAPMVIGTVLLESGESVKSFLCETAAIASATEISQYGGWRGYLSARAQGNKSS